jgi:hypothetical protein
MLIRNTNQKIFLLNKVQLYKIQKIKDELE